MHSVKHNRPQRRSVRLRGFDYATPGAYFITICTQERACLFGEVENGLMLPNAAGRMVEEWWQELGRKFEAVDPDTFVFMPNHIHGILMNDGADAGAHAGAPLPEIVQWFKTMTMDEKQSTQKTAVLVGSGIGCSRRRRQRDFQLDVWRASSIRSLR